MPSSPWHERIGKSAEHATALVLVLNLGDADRSLESDGAGLVVLGDQPGSLRRLFAELSLRCQLEWSACADDNGFIRLPSYPWQRESFWLPRDGIGNNSALPRIAAPKNKRPD